MFKDNLLSLRKMKHMSQEELAEAMEVSRQTISKWETGEALPDIERCKRLADLFDVSMDELVNYESKETGLGMPPRGKHAFGMVTVGEKGQIVIPAKARKLFQIEAGDRLFVLGDEATGLAMIREKDFLSIFKELGGR